MVLPHLVEPLPHPFHRAFTAQPLPVQVGIPPVGEPVAHRKLPIAHPIEAIESTISGPVTELLGPLHLSPGTFPRVQPGPFRSLERPLHDPHPLRLHSEAVAIDEGPAKVRLDQDPGASLGAGLRIRILGGAGGYHAGNQ